MNPCKGIWARKGSGEVTNDSWGSHDSREKYYSLPEDFDGRVVTLHPYAETIKDARRMHLPIGLKPEFVRERFEFLGLGIDMRTA